MVRGDAATPSNHGLRAKDLLLLCGLTVAAFLIHGYHPYVEDAEIYLPGILKQLHPTLFPHDAPFFQAHARMSFFPQIVAASMRLLPVPVSVALLLWQVGTIFLLLYGCRRLVRVCFADEYASWCGVSLVTALLSIPVAGTALYIMDQYLTARSVSTPAGVLALASVLEGGYVAAAFWILITAVVHPLMAVFPAALVAIIILLRHWPQRAQAIAFFPGGLFSAVTPAYRRVLATRPYFFLTKWAWFEWLGILGPVALFAWFARIAKKKGFDRFELLCRALIIYQTAFVTVALVVSIPGRFENLAEMQPLRSFHLVYVALFLFGGALLAKFILKKQVMLWLLLLVPVCLGMWFAQRQLFPATPHLEWPWIQDNNPWVKAFEWIRVNTPEDAYFVLDPDHMDLPGEDEHGFRAIAERSMLADQVKDSGAAIMFPALADVWEEQVDAQKGFQHFNATDFEKLKQRYGVNWIIEKPGETDIPCAYENESVAVCKLE